MFLNYSPINFLVMKSTFKIFALATIVAFLFAPKANAQSKWQTTPGGGDVNVLTPIGYDLKRIHIGPWPDGSFPSYNNYGRLHVQHNSDGGTDAHLTLRETDAGDYARLQFMNTHSTGLPARWHIAAKTTSSDPVNAQMNFWYHNGGSTGNDLMTIRGDGKVGIGTTSPIAKLNIKNGYLALSPSSGTSFGITAVTYSGAGYLQFSQFSGSTATPKIDMSSTTLEPHTDGLMSLGRSGFRWSAVWAQNGTIQTSDETMKKNVQPLSYGLEEVLQMKPVSYEWKEMVSGTSTNLGFLAQEMEMIVPEVVVRGDVASDNDVAEGKRSGGASLGMKYSELIPVLVNAIQEQQQEITELRTWVAEHEFQIENLEARLARLEALVAGQGAAANTQTASPTSRTAQAANKIQICFPNPVTDILTVALEKAVADENTCISLFDLSGREVKKANLKAGENSQQLIVNDLAAGVYTLSLFLNGSISSSMQVVIAR
jgi:uncharacterized coiled-coil protein SlyX